MEEFLLSCGKKNCRWQPELLILLFGRTRTCSFSSKILRFTLCLNDLQYQTESVFFFSFVCLFFSPSLHIHEKLTNSGTCPSMLSSRAHSFNTFSTNLDLFPQPDKELLASWGAFWHKASQLKALKKNFSQCCVDTDLHGGRVGFALVLRGS